METIIKILITDIVLCGIFTVITGFLSSTEKYDSFIGKVFMFLATVTLFLIPIIGIIAIWSI